MEATERTVSQILTEQIQYKIPAYQRPYSWEKGNVEQLLNDVWEAFAANDEEYFIGSLITIEREKGRLYDVVDGQQRLTTLNLIFSRLRTSSISTARTLPSGMRKVAAVPSGAIETISTTVSTRRANSTPSPAGVRLVS